MTAARIGDGQRASKTNVSYADVVSLEDLQIGGCLHAVVLRSPHAHALISRIDVERARSMPGVVLVWTAEDLDRCGIKPLLPSARVNAPTRNLSSMPCPMARTRCAMWARHCLGGG